MTNIDKFVRDLNTAWGDHRYEDLYEFFHDDVVMLPPGTSEPIVGIEPMIESYRQFVSMGTIHAFDITNLTVYEYGTFSMCHMRFEVDYEIESGRFREEGLEVYAIDTSGAGPRIVWRTQIAMKPSDA